MSSTELREIDAAVAHAGAIGSAAPQFVALDRSFDLERAGSVVRIWCVTCQKHQVLVDDSVRTIEAARELHRCGPRTDEWDCAFHRGPGGSA